MHHVILFDEGELTALLFVTECTSLSSIPLRSMPGWLRATEKLRKASWGALVAADDLWIANGKGSFHYIPEVTQ